MLHTYFSMFDQQLSRILVSLLLRLLLGIYKVELPCNTASNAFHCQLALTNKIVAVIAEVSAERSCGVF